MNFELSEEQFDDPQSRDINNKAFWDKLHEVFQVTLEMVKETAQEWGIDLDTLDLQQANEENQASRELAENHECCQAAKEYSQMVKKWFDSAGKIFEQKADDLALKVQLELPDSNPAKEAADLKDAVDVIQWYQHFIYVKLVRAIRGSIEEPSPPRRAEGETGLDLDEFPKDSDGSAKIALIAMDRSIAAWGRMLEYFPQNEEDILNILVHLDRLRRKVEAVLPDARAFVRPGFDDIA
jgi:hypothetical protein